EALLGGDDTRPHRRGGRDLAERDLGGGLRRRDGERHRLQRQHGWQNNFQSKTDHCSLFVPTWLWRLPSPRRWGPIPEAACAARWVPTCAGTTAEKWHAYTPAHYVMAPCALKPDCGFRFQPA